MIDEKWGLVILRILYYTTRLGAHIFSRQEEYIPPGARTTRDEINIRVSRSPTSQLPREKAQCPHRTPRQPRN